MNPAESTIRYLRIYCGAMAAFYALYVIAGAVLFANAADLANRENPAAMWQMMGIAIGGVGIVLSAAHVATFAFPRKKWVWIYDLVMICLGFGSICTIVFSVILLIQWIKPEVQAAYGMGEAAPRTPWRPE